MYVKKMCRIKLLITNVKKLTPPENKEEKKEKEEEKKKKEKEKSRLNKNFSTSGKFLKIN